MDERVWENPTAIAAIRDLTPRLPHLKPILVAFFRGALDTWERFTAEFAPGGLIDLASASERESAWMPSTNDANEGALGSYRLHARSKPKTTMHLYNSQAMVRRNDTENFITAKFTDEDHTFLRVQARMIDGSKLELQRRQAQIDFDQRVVDLKRRKDEEKQKKAAELVERLAGVSVILDPVGLDNLIVKDLKMQLEWHQQWDISDGNKIPKKSHLTNKSAHRIALGDAVERYKAHTPSIVNYNNVVSPMEGIVAGVDGSDTSDSNMDE